MNEANFRYSTLGLAPGLARKHQTRLEKLARDERSSELQKFVTYGRKKSYNIGHGDELLKTFYGRKLQLLVISLSVHPLQAFPGQYNVCG